MREPLWFVWVSTFTRLAVCGDAYLMLPRGEVRESARIAGVVYRACRRIRRGAA